MDKNRRANKVVFGFDFQVNAAIVLMLENITGLKSLRLEGAHEDIELELNNGQSILAQAKAIERGSSDFRNVRLNLKKSLQSLSDGNKKVDAKQLILITNSFNPLNDEASRGLFSGLPTHRRFDTLPETSQKIINGYLEQITDPLDKNKFWIQTIPFETDDDSERYKNIIQAVNDFIGDLHINIPGMGKQLLTLWHCDVFKNGSKKDSAIMLSKKDIIWPMLVIATDIDRCDEEFLNQFEPDIYDETVHLYKEIIDSCCEKCEIFIKVLYDYNSFKSSKNPSERCVDFAMSRWRDYIEDFSIPEIDSDTQEALTKIVIYNIVRRRLQINKIKQGVNL